MPLAPCEEWQAQMTECEKKKWRGYCEGQDIGRINSCKARPPESPGIEIVRSIGMNQHKAGEDEEEVHTDIANAGKVLVPPGSSAENSLHLEVEQDHMKSGKESQGGESVEPPASGEGSLGRGRNLDSRHRLRHASSNVSHRVPLSRHTMVPLKGRQWTPPKTRLTFVSHGKSMILRILAGKLSLEEVESHLQAFADSPLVQAIIGTAALAGLRLGEIRGLWVEDDEGYLSVEDDR